MAKPKSPSASSPRVRRLMQAIPQRDTTIEMRLRSQLHHMGLRFRVHSKPLIDSPRRADIVFRKSKVAVFVDGCFWHGCPEHSQVPKTNSTYWKDKIERNRVRDTDTDSVLQRSGWLPLRFWAHESYEEAADQVMKAVRLRLGIKR